MKPSHPFDETSKKLFRNPEFAEAYLEECFASDDLVEEGTRRFKSLRSIMAQLPEKRRRAIEARAAVLIAEEKKRQKRKSS